LHHEGYTEDARLVDIALLDRRFLALVLERSFPADGGGWAPRADAITVLEVDLRGSAARIRRYWSIDDELHLGLDDEIQSVSATVRGVNVTIGREEGKQSCDMTFRDKAARFACRPIAGEKKPEIDRAAEIIDRQAPGKWGVLAQSPSGRWVAWTEHPDDADIGAANLYVAPVADLPQP
jgi:hypothetical protein